MFQNPLWILAVLASNVALSEWLVRRSWLRHLGSALLVILLTAIAANLRIIPTYSDEVAVYAGVFEYLAPLAIFLLLLQVHLKGIVRAGSAMLSVFLLGSVATMLGVLVGMWAVGGHRVFGDLGFALGGMFVGTYTGGSINFNAVAIEYGVVKDGLLYAGAAAVDNAATTVWMAATVALPRLLVRWNRGALLSGSNAAAEPVSTPSSPMAEEADLYAHDTETVSPLDVSMLVALGAGSVWLSDRMSESAARAWDVSVPSILILTTLALVLAQIPAIQRLRGTRLTGWIAVMLFLAVIGALCDFSALRQIGQIGRQLLIFVSITVAVHGLIVFGVGQLLRVDPAMTAVASQANIGGSTSALALARSLGRADLMLPAILVGSLGNALGTYLGFLVAAGLR